MLALVSEIIGTIGGFGSSLLFVPIAGYFLDFHSVLGVTAMFHISSNVTKIALFKHGFDRKLILYMGIPAVVFVMAGAWISKYMDSALLQTILGCFLILMSLALLLFRQLAFKPTNSNSVGSGILSGFVAGLLGTGGAIRGLALSAFHLKTEVFIATSAIIDLGVDSSRTIIYGMNGYLHTHDLYLIPLLFVVSVIGTYIGRYLLRFVSETQFRRTVLLLILGTGIFTLMETLHIF